MAGATAARRGLVISVKVTALAGSTLDNLEDQLAAEKVYNRALPHGETLLAFFAGRSRDGLMSFVAALRSRLEAETDILDRFTALGLDPFAPDLLMAPLPFPVSVVDHLESDCVVGGHPNACFREGTVFHVGSPPPLAERLGALAMRGLIGNDLFHEVFHGLQGGAGSYRSIDEVLQALGGDPRAQARTALAEAHAWLRSLPGFRSDLIADVVTSAYGLRCRNQVDTAVHLLSTAFALGLDDVQVGRMVGEAEWSESQGTFPSFTATVQALANAQGLGEEALAEQVEWLRLVERVQGVRAMGIARELVEATLLAEARSSATAAAG